MRRPLRPTSPATKALLDHLERVGFDGAPRYLGVDDCGREVLSFIPGQAAIAPYPDWALTDDALVSVAQLLRRYHDAVASFDPSGHRWPHPLPRRFDHGLVSHNDPNLDNVIFENGRAVALIDFDLASPGSVAWDLACSATTLGAAARATRHARRKCDDRSLARLALFADAYGASQRNSRRTDRSDGATRTTGATPSCAAPSPPATRHSGSTGAAGGKPEAERTRRWLATHAPQMRAALGLENASTNRPRHRRGYPPDPPRPRDR